MQYLKGALWVNSLLKWFTLRPVQTCNQHQYRGHHLPTQIHQLCQHHQMLLLLASSPIVWSQHLPLILLVQEEGIIQVACQFRTIIIHHHITSIWKSSASYPLYFSASFTYESTLFILDWFCRFRAGIWSRTSRKWRRLSDFSRFCTTSAAPSPTPFE